MVVIIGSEWHVDPDVLGLIVLSLDEAEGRVHVCSVCIRSGQISTFRPRKLLARFLPSVTPSGLHSPLISPDIFLTPFGKLSWWRLSRVFHDLLCYPN